MCVVAFRKCDVNWINERGRTALDNAVEKNRLENVKLLLDHGAGENLYKSVAECSMAVTVDSG